MYSNYFEKLKSQARYLDDGIEKLNETWKLPSVLVGRFGECTEETESHVEAIWNTIKNTQNGIEEILVKLKEDELKDSESMEQLLQETKGEYESLKEACDGLETVLNEYGYHYDSVDTLNSANVNNSKESSQHLAKEMKNLEIEFTPNLNWKRKVKQSEPLTLSFNGTCISTPVTAISSEASNSSFGDTAVINQSTYTPIAERPKEQIYSKHFYKLFKK